MPYPPGQTENSKTDSTGQIERRLAAILAADVVGYSRLMGKDEAGTLAALKAHRRDLIDPQIAAHKGRIVKLMGDGVLVEFASVVNALECAMDIQHGMSQRNSMCRASRRIDLRIGINLGDVIIDGDDIYGDGVNVAARIEGIAEPGGVCISGTVFEHVKSKVKLGFADLGEQHLKNIAEPVQVFGVKPYEKPDRPTSADLPAAGRPSIAVLPFNNMSGDAEQEYFADGITEDIITDLAKVSGLSVIARNSVFTYKGKAADVQEVSRRFNVTTVLEGSVRKVGQRVRITAQLINGKDGLHLWADRYDRDLTDIFAIQDEINHMIVDQLKVRLLPEERDVIDQVPTGNIEAYTYYLRGRQFFHRHSKSHYTLAKRMFNKAIELDPLYARAYAGIADCDSVLFLHYNESIVLKDILATSARALELDNSLAEAHASRALALSLEEHYSEAEAEFERSIALNRNLYEAHYFYGRACVAQGKTKSAARLFERASEIEPDDYQAQLLLPQLYRSLGRQADALNAAHRGIELAQNELATNPENARAAYLGANALAIVGDPGQSRKLAARALAIDPEEILTQYNVACVYSLLGDLEPAIEMLQQLLPKANHETKAWLRQDIDLVPLHSHPDWQSVLALAM